MKKVFLAGVLLLLSPLFLAACGNDEYDKWIEAGKEAQTQEKYDESIEAFQKAKAVKTTDYVDQKIAYVEALYYEERFQTGKKMIEEGNFAAAIEAFTTALSINKEINENNEEIEKSLEEAKKKESIQTDLDAYVEWVKSTNQRYFTISDGWRKVVEKSSVNGMNQKQLNAALLPLLETTSKLMTEVDEKAYDLSANLTPIHTKLVKDTGSFYQSLLSAVTYFNEYEAPKGSKRTYQHSDLLKFDSTMSSIQENQAKFIASLKEYADRHGLRLRL